MKSLITYFVVVLWLFSPTVHAQKTDGRAIAQKAIPRFTYKLINGASNTFGYDLYADKKLKIHQPSIPAMPGNGGFKTKTAAERVARLAVAKMKNGESLPTISIEELKALKAI